MPQPEVALTPNALRVLEARYLRTDAAGHVVETPGEMFRRVATHVAAVEKQYGECPDGAAEVFYDAMVRLEFLPNSPALMNAGTTVGQLAACFVLPVEDSLDRIFGTLHDATLVQQTGGGVGYDFSRLRPAGDRVTSTGGLSSGPVSFMKAFDAAVEAVRQGGRRRGANMAVLDVHHPDVEAFITAKRSSPVLRNFNLSVAVDDAFMQAAADGGEVTLLNPRTGQPSGQKRAADLLHVIAESAWACGDPGLIFVDRINRDNPTPALGRITATNPCGEVPLLPYEACVLGSIKAALEEFEKELDKLLHQLPKWQRESRDKERALKRSLISAAVDTLIDDLAKEYETEGAVQPYLEHLKTDVIEHADDLHRGKSEPEEGLLAALMARSGGEWDALRRYRVNVLVDHSRASGASVIYEDRPTFQNLVGRIEHVAQIGTLVTHFTLIKPGALHRANGGYLMLDARRLLLEPFAWEGLKRALRARALRIESLGEALSLISTVTLDPEPIPLDVKVVLIGERLLYYLLYELDPDFKELFKVAVDFESRMDSTAENDSLYARLIGALVRRAALRPFSAAAVARVLEHGARVMGDAGKLWLGLDGLTDLLQEASHCADAAGHGVVEPGDVQQAIDAWVFRAGGPRQRIQEEIARGTIAIATRGDAVGQVNGLSVVELGGFAFAHPSRITARVHLGAGTVVDIEREVELGGPIHSKGVLILSGYLAGHYVAEQPLSLAASIVFEQSYGGVEGDSASSAELFALLSALAKVPIRQGIAVTGSINQRGNVQAVGGVNEKIEGFFDVCKAAGLTGDQGVLIPAANMAHLMLRENVRQAVADGTFHIYAMASVDDGIEILTGLPAGTRDDEGRFPDRTVNQRVEQRLLDFAERARAFRLGAVGSKGDSLRERGELNATRRHDSPRRLRR